VLRRAAEEQFMRNLVLKMSVSLDGFVGGLDGEIDWIFRSMDEGATDWLLETLWQAGLHLMGRRTFSDMAAYWPSCSSPLAASMNAIPKVVYSRKRLVLLPDTQATRVPSEAMLARRIQSVPIRTGSASEASWAAATVVHGELTDAVTALKREPGDYILAHGGARFGRALAESGLVDEYRLLVHPVVLGCGLPLFAGIARPVDLRLLSSTIFPSGAVAQIYRPA
jgi:dihydrofolate reductase